MRATLDLHLLPPSLDASWFDETSFGVLLGTDGGTYVDPGDALLRPTWRVGIYYSLGVGGLPPIRAVMGMLKPSTLLLEL